MSKIENFLKENKILVIAYILTTLFFIYQHYKILNWDFITYILNAKYIFSNGNYFEWFRDPLSSIFLGIFSIFTWKFSPYLYIIFVSSLHLFSSIKLSEKFNLDKKVYYLISLSPFLLLEGLKNGTELLSLSFIQLFLAYFDNYLAGIFFGLSFLTRYTSISLLPLILFLKKPKKIIMFLLIFLIVISPWLIFNYIKTGNPFLSIADSYALNIRFRDYLNDRFPLSDFLVTFGYLILFSLLWLYKNIKKLKQGDFMMLLILVLSLIAFYRIPVKSYTLRYLFLIIIPLSYFSTIILTRIKKHIILILFLISLIISIVVTNNTYADNLEKYKQALPYLGNCSTYSSNWIYLNYLDKNTKPDIYNVQIKAKLENGDRVLMYYNNVENLYIKNETFLKDLPIIIKNDEFILFGNKSKCNSDEGKIDKPYIINLRNTILEIYNYTQDISNCYIFFKRKLPLIC